MQDDIYACRSATKGYSHLKNHCQSKNAALDTYFSTEMQINYEKIKHIKTLLWAVCWR